METLEGGDMDGMCIGAGVLSIFALGAALGSTGVGAPLGVAFALVGFGMAMYDAGTGC